MSLCYFGVQHSVWLVALLFGVVNGLGVGIAYVVPLVCGMSVRFLLFTIVSDVSVRVLMFIVGADCGMFANFLLLLIVKGTNPPLKKSLNIPEIYAKMLGRFQ